jgi:hypothetical protein
MWVSPQKPGTSVGVDSAVGQMGMFRPRNKWAPVHYRTRTAGAGKSTKSRAWIGVGGALCDVSGARVWTEGIAVEVLESCGCGCCCGSRWWRCRMPSRVVATEMRMDDNGWLLLSVYLEV